MSEWIYDVRRGDVGLAVRINGKEAENVIAIRPDAALVYRSGADKFLVCWGPCECPKEELASLNWDPSPGCHPAIAIVHGDVIWRRDAGQGHQ